MIPCKLTIGDLQGETALPGETAWLGRFPDIHEIVHEAHVMEPPYGGSARNHRHFDESEAQGPARLGVCHNSRGDHEAELEEKL